MAYEQINYQFRRDDGTEVMAHGIVQEGTNIVWPRLATLRIRIQLDSSVDDPPTAQVKIQYRLKE